MASLHRPIFGILLLAGSICSLPCWSADEGRPVDNFQMPMADPLPLMVTELASSSDWSLPLEERLGTDSTKPVSAKANLPKRFDASINLSDGHNAISSRIDELLDSALDRDPQTQVFNKSVAHYRTKTQRVVAEAKDTADYLIPYRGFGPSSEAGDIILDEKVKLKSRASAEYARQRHVDDVHVKLVSNMMQVAMGLGMADKTRSTEAVGQGHAALKELVGEQEAQHTLEMLNTWMRDLNVPESVYEQGAWDVTTRQEKFKIVMQNALEDDPVLHEITKRLHKYNHRSKFARTSAHVVQTTLGAAALTPTFVGPAAKAALVAFVMATGGPEQCKLLKELYLDKRFESRWKALNEETHLALENYHIAILTRNPVLLACSEALIDSMAGEDTVEKVFGHSVMPKQTVAAAGSQQ